MNRIYRIPKSATTGKKNFEDEPVTAKLVKAAHKAYAKTTKVRSFSPQPGQIYIDLDVRTVNRRLKIIAVTGMHVHVVRLDLNDEPLRKTTIRRDRFTPRFFSVSAIPDKNQQ